MIRAIEAGDRARWTELWTRYLEFYKTVLPPEVFDSTWSRLHDRDEPIWGAVAIEAGAPVGLVHYIFHRTAWAVAETCYLQDLYVDPEYRGRGHARSLIEYVAAEARKRHCPRVYWITQQDNATARLLYDRIAKHTGFIQYGMPLNNT